MEIIHDVTRRGDVDSLRRILAANPGFPLADPKFTCFLRTPLHVAAMHDYVEFASEIVGIDPQLANETDSLGSTPLHFATARDNLDMVRMLLNVSTDACIVPDNDGRTPLHIAARRNKVELMELLIQSRPEAIHQRLQNTNETILHLCVKHDNFMAMEKLIDYLVANPADPANNPDPISVNSIDSDGNTILHLAAQKKRMKILKYLIGSSEIGVDVNIRNNTPEKLRALDMLDQNELYALGIGCFDIHITKEVPLQSTTSSKKWLKERLNTLMIVATLIAGIAFQAVINPPGGFFQDDSKIDSFMNPVMFTYYLKNVIGTPMSEGFQSYIDKLPQQKTTRGNITADEIIADRAKFVKLLLTGATSRDYSHTSPYMSHEAAPGIILEEDRWKDVISSYNNTIGGGSGFSPYLIRYAGTAIMAYRSPRVYEVYIVLNSLSLTLCVVTIVVVSFDIIDQPISMSVRYVEVMMVIAVGCIFLSYTMVLNIISPPFYVFKSLNMKFAVALLGVIVSAPLAAFIFILLLATIPGVLLSLDTEVSKDKITMMISTTLSLGVFSFSCNLM